MFQAGRFIAGLGIGILVTICPMYLSELAPPARRGWLVGHHAIFLVFGYMLSAWLGYGCYFATASNPSFAWRFPLCMQCLAPLILGVNSAFMPESPRWLVQKGKSEQAWTIIQRLRKSPDDPTDLVAKEEMYQTKAQLALDEAKLRKLNVTPWTAVLKIKSYRKRMIIGFLTQWGAEFSGPLVIVSTTLSCLEAADRSQEQLFGAAVHKPRPDRRYASTALRFVVDHSRYVFLTRSSMLCAMVS
jgi:MFS family permease